LWIVEDHRSEAISEGEDGYLDFNMHPVNVAVVNSIKELKAENEALKTENRALRQDIEQIKAVLGL
jgi:cell division protein FtsB